MKSITESLLKAMYEVTILEELNSVWKSTAETKEIQNKFRDFCNTDLRGQSISLDNKDNVKKIHKKFYKTLLFGSDTQILDRLKKYGLATPEGFRKWILGSHDEMVKNKINTDWVKQWDLTKAESDYKKVKEAGEIPEPISQEEAEERDLVIYDKNDPSVHEVYPFKGKRGRSTERQVNRLRVDFKYRYGVEYYDCYSILLKNYLGKEEELKKRAECNQGYDDPNDF